MFPLLGLLDSLALIRFMFRAMSSLDSPSTVAVLLISLLWLGLFLFIASIFKVDERIYDYIVLNFYQLAKIYNTWASGKNKWA